MVDSNDRERVNEAREELTRMLAEDELRDAVLLVFVNKQVCSWLSEYWNCNLLSDAHLKIEIFKLDVCLPLSSPYHTLSSTFLAFV